MFYGDRFLSYKPYLGSSQPRTKIGKLKYEIVSTLITNASRVLAWNHAMLHDIEDTCVWVEENIRLTPITKINLQKGRPRNNQLSRRILKTHFQIRH